MVHNLVAMATTATDPELGYTEEELRSFLPSGWNLTQEEGTWDPKKRTWAFNVLDEVDFDWLVEVRAEEALELGRLQALKRAVDRTERDRLGRRTKGLGI